ncbi:autophagy protein 8 [Dacryopinax primogenitus]|uniref:Autophagy-related protein n=1 Tax=Dacryopinax primogenitus (strain DJM 731) TaxID=1858805 RepID=M5FT34_DACPD|nr:autophagy protein 8 [Dacryopinax primogenitus]EJT98529.1 autophagy protein 8 [Dacryopinax primogenitus]
MPVPAIQGFKQEHSFGSRQKESARLRAQYPDRIPIIVERAEGSNAPPLDRTRFLVPSDLSVGQFHYIIRKRIKLRPEDAIFLFVQEATMPPTATLMSAMYEQYQDEDGFLYVKYAGENTFGGTLS